MGNVGIHLERENDINQLQAGTAQQLAAQGLNQNSFRPYKGFALIRMSEKAARSEYHGLQVEVNRRFARGLGYGFAYTYSKSMDNGSDCRDRPIDPFDDKSFWGKSDFDTRHVAVINFNYELPFWKSAGQRRHDDRRRWQLSGVSPVPDRHSAGGRYGRRLRRHREQQHAALESGTPHQPGAFLRSQSDPNFWFTPTNGAGHFHAPAAGTFSKQNRNTVPFNPRFPELERRSDQEVPDQRRHRVQFRAEFFNWPNHPNWSVDTAHPALWQGEREEPRNVQLSLRYSF